MTGQAFSHSRIPVPAVIAVVVHEGRALLVRRANPPDAGLWGFPGGKIDFGETVADAAIRELREETGIAAEAQELITALDVLAHHAKKWIRFFARTMRCSRSEHRIRSQKWFPLLGPMLQCPATTGASASTTS
ncbi:NUDIX hydrolase [Microvirga sp. M2]|uniref:NUDIX hydrolase n=1 Tax=Microvirga sp. M2 TaxID=3073270 RepID=UPI0039C19F37